MNVWNILQTFGKFYDHLVHFVLIWYIFHRFRYHVPRKIWQPWPAGRFQNQFFSQHGEKKIFMSIFSSFGAPSYANEPQVCHLTKLSNFREKNLKSNLKVSLLKWVLQHCATSREKRMKKKCDKKGFISIRFDAANDLFTNDKNEVPRRFPKRCFPKRLFPKWRFPQTISPQNWA
jgi:hypothetical protein